MPVVRSSRGFTLVEMAVVVTIIGIVLMTVFPALTATRKANRLALTHSNLRSLMTATAAFVQANGCLPCPAVPGGTGTRFGHLGYPSTTTVCGDCSASPAGLAPFVALGLPASVARDGWGHWITMRVDPALTNPVDVIVPPTAPCTAQDVESSSYGCATVGAAIKGLCTPASGSSGGEDSGVMVTTTGNGATQYAAVLFVSHGSTGYGAYIASPQENGDFMDFPSSFAPCNGIYGGYARCNSPKENSRHFYDAPSVVSDFDPYDNVLAYASRNVLISMLGNGACHSKW